jgi:hypothetical protein
MSLQDALTLAENFYDGTDYHFDRLTPDEQETIVDAARRLANAERAMVVASLWIEDERQWVMVLENDVDAAEGAPFYLVNADALGITEATK